MKTFKQFLTESKKEVYEASDDKFDRYSKDIAPYLPNKKYKKGEFGYWWVIEKGNKDIENEIYKGDIYCDDNDLTSLKGCPKEVKGDFDCSWNKLTSLKGAPQKVSEGFYCQGNKLTSLEGAPKEVGGYFDCSDNKLTSLKGMPKKIGGEFNCTSNNKLFHIDNYVAGVVGADIWSDDWNWDEE